MPKQQTHVRVVRQWCQSLGILSAVSISRQEAEMKLAAYVPMLMDRFPDAAFTAASLEHVAARAVKGFPTYGELAEWLAEWWRENRPPIANALPAPPPWQRAPEPERPPPTEDEIAYVRARVAEIAAILSRPPEPQLRSPGPRYLTPAQLDQVNPLPGGLRRVPLPSTTTDRPSTVEGSADSTAPAAG